MPWLGWARRGEAWVPMARILRKPSNTSSPVAASTLVIGVGTQAREERPGAGQGIP